MLGSYRARLSEEYAIFNKAKHLVYCPTYIDQEQIRMDLTMVKACCGKDVSAAELTILTGINCLFGGKIFFGMLWKKMPEEHIIVVKEGCRDIINEAFRVLRTNLEFMSEKDKKSNVILSTSFNPGSGKSFLTMNMAFLH